MTTFLRFLSTSFLLGWWALTMTPAEAETARTLFEQGQTAAQHGKLEQAIDHWQAALQGESLDRVLQVQILIQLAAIYQALGLPAPAQESLLQAQKLTKNSPLLETQVLTQLSDLALATRQDEKAHEYAYQSQAKLPANAPFVLQATVLNNLGNVLAVEAYYNKAIETYAQSVEAAQQASDYILGAKALINMAYAQSKLNQESDKVQFVNPWPAVTASLSMALQKLDRAAPDYNKTFSLLSIGTWAQQLESEATKHWRNHSNSADQQPPLVAPLATLQKELRSLALTALNQALTLAKDLQNSRLLSYVYGYLGQLYETEQRYDDSLPLTRQAIFFAQQDQTSFFTQPNQASEILYRWQWQLGRLFRIQPHSEEAINAYRDAVKSLQPVRWELSIGYRNSSLSFREAVGPVYFELTDLLLQRAANTTGTEKAQWLTEAQDTMEQLKAAELQDYFRDECVADFQMKRAPLDHIPKTAVLYPILLPDRVEMLLSLPTQIQQFSLPISANQLKEEVNEFRLELESSDSEAYLAYAQRLYQWLIAPLMPTLTAQDLDTLVIIPDGVLRIIPFAALHDGKNFLISRYAIAITPGLTLTEAPKPLAKNSAKILVGGLSDSINGYSRLLSVQEEVNLIKNLYGSEVTVLLNQNFTVDNFAEAVKNNLYSIVHIASHGQFDSDPQKTFILTYNGKLTMNRLAQLIRLSEIRHDPMELLTLSACETAVGDDQAALGLGGVAIKAGARSALASLWVIDDTATTQLMIEFYRQLRRDGMTKARALQAAQKQLLTQSRYRHPAFWAPFLLIGNWL